MTLQTPRRGGRTEQITIPVGGVYRIDTAGNFARCIAASSDDTFLRIDNTGETLRFNAGKYWRAEPGDSFQTVEIIGTAGQTVEYYVGWGTYGDDLKELAGGVTAELTTYQFDGLTRSQLYTTMITYVGSAATQIWPGIAGGAELSVQVIGRDPTRLGAVFLGRTNTVSTAGFGSLLTAALNEYAPGGATIVPAQGEVWAVSNVSGTLVALTATQLEGT